MNDSEANSIGANASERLNSEQSSGVATPGSVASYNAADALRQGLDCRDKGDIVGAIAWLTKAIAIGANASERLNSDIPTLGGVGSYSERLNSEQSGVATVGAVASYIAEAYLERGRLLLAMGDKAGAEADMRQWLALSPGQLDTISGNFQAKGTEQRPQKRPRSIMNPYGI